MALERGGGGGVAKAKAPVSAQKIPKGNAAAAANSFNAGRGVGSPYGAGYVAADAATGIPYDSSGSNSYGVGGDYYGGSGGGGGVAPSVTAPTEEDYLAGDSGFQTQSSALASALQRYLADTDFQRKNYETDYKKSLRDLGYDEGEFQSWRGNVDVYYLGPPPPAEEIRWILP